MTHEQIVREMQAAEAYRAHISQAIEERANTYYQTMQEQALQGNPYGRDVGDFLPQQNEQALYGNLEQIQQEHFEDEEDRDEAYEFEHSFGEAESEDEDVSQDEGFDQGREIN